MAGRINLTYRDGVPIPNIPIVVYPTIGWTPTTDVNGTATFSVPSQGNYTVTVVVNNLTFTNSMAFDSVGVAPTLNWQVAVDSPVTPPPVVAIDYKIVAVGAAALVLVAVGIYYFTRKKR